MGSVLPFQALALDIQTKEPRVVLTVKKNKVISFWIVDPASL
jgi:hypothetical protein